ALVVAELRNGEAREREWRPGSVLARARIRHLDPGQRRHVNRYGTVLRDRVCERPDRRQVALHRTDEHVEGRHEWRQCHLVALTIELELGELQGQRRWPVRELC